MCRHQALTVLTKMNFIIKQHSLMNLFFLHLNAVLAAKQQCDKHVVKMLLETAQILSSVCRYFCIDDCECLYKETHKNHPVVIWTRTSNENFEWVIEHGFALCREYTLRYNKIHKSEAIIAKINELYKSKRDNFNFPIVGFTQPEMCMPDEYKINNDIVASYRMYYIKDKSSFAKWKYTPVPEWFSISVN